MEKELTVKDAVVPPRKGRVKRREVNSMEIFEKRGVWYIKEKGKELKTFSSREKAEIAAGIGCEDATEAVDGSEEEEESSEEKTSTNK